MDPFIGQIMMFAGNFAPRGWALCDGQLLSISSNSALFSILGTTYGGDGRTTFALPDLRGRVPVHQGAGKGLSPYKLGQKTGVENVTLDTNQIPAHTHAATATATAKGSDSANANAQLLANATWGHSSATIYTSGVTPDTDMHPGCVSVSVANQNTGGGQPHTNVQPVLCVNFVIAIVGIFPSRN